MRAVRKPVQAGVGKRSTGPVGSLLSRMGMGPGTWSAIWRQLPPWPLPAQTDDGNAWETGGCWLYCRRAGVRVLWLGPVRTPGADGHLYGCWPCIAELTRMIRQEPHRRDRANVRVLHPAAAFVRVPPHVPSCRHRSMDGKVGLKFCEECGGQIYL